MGARSKNGPTFSYFNIVRPMVEKSVYTKYISICDLQFDYKVYMDKQTDGREDGHH